MRSRWFGGVLALGVVLGPRGATAAEETKERQITTTEIESWLEAEPAAAPKDKGVTPEDEKPLLAPRRHGFVLESGVGFVTQIGALAHIT
ncbi:MAG TPA: hypothetical protein VGQ57_06365, partial [Polyangiaceae bacterium]|nr:hypothetical protein [Polyangiaceae bacterium]